MFLVRLFSVVVLIVFSARVAWGGPPIEGALPSTPSDSPPSSPPTPPSPASPGAQNSFDDCNTAYSALFDKDDQPTGNCSILGKNSDMRQTVQLAQAFLSMQSSNPVNACSQITALASTANVALAVFQGSCSGTVKSCVDTCNKARRELGLSDVPSTATFDNGDPKRLTAAGALSQVNMQLRNCRDMAANLPSQTAAVMQWVATNNQAAQNCALIKQQLSQQQAMACELNPNSPACANALSASDCTNTANNSPVCTCYRNPSSCGNSAQSQAATTAGALSTGSGGPGVGAGTAGAGGADGSMLYSGDPQAIGKGAAPGTGTVGGGGGGSGVNLGGGSSGGGSGGKAGPAAVAAGQTPSKSGYGGTIGSNNGSATQAGSGYGSGGDKAQRGVFGGNLATAPNLNKFLPGPYDPQRNLASSGIDGITGPNTDLWMKVKNQYSNQQSRGTLLGK